MQAPVAAPAASPDAAAPAGADADALKLHDRELDAVRAQERASAESQAKLRREIDTLGDDRRALNQQLIDTATRVRNVEASITAEQTRLKPLDDRETSLRKSLDERRTVIAEILAALQRVGHQPPPALVVAPEDALQAVRTAITLGSVVPEMRVQADALAGDLADLVRVREDIDGERTRLTRDLDTLGREQLRLNILIDERQQTQATTEQALEAERAHAADLARRVDSLKELIAKLEASLDPGVRAAHAEARSIEEDATRPDLAALKDPGRLAPAVAFAAMRGHLHLPVNGTKIREFGASDSGGGTQKGQSIATHPG